MPTNADQDLDEELEEDLDSDEETEDETDEEADADEDGEGQVAAAATKRLRDLQSKADKETARANKAERELNALRQAAGKAKSSSGDGAGAGAVPPEIQQWLDTAVSSARTRMYESEPRFAEYGIDPALINGSTPDQMSESAEQLKRLVARVETRVRRKVLREHGFADEPKGSGRVPKRDFATMSKEDFDAVVRQHLG